MSMATGGRVGVVVLLLLVAAVVAVPLLPGDPAAIRLAGVGALWWFAAFAAPLIATLTTCAFLRPPTNVPTSRSDTAGRTLTTSTRLATWASPVMLVSLAASVFAGTPDSPALVLTALVAPLLALLARSADPAPPTNQVAGLAIAAAVGLVLWANLGVIADVARLVGVPRPPALALSATVAFVAITRRAARRPVGDGGVLVGAAGVVLPVVVIGVTVAATPWTAWSRTASQPALTFGQASVWVTEGRPLEGSTTLVFTEPHRVTALSPGVYRVVEEGAKRSVTREWRLAAGDALTLRPGDRLALAAGTRIRFEPGKRVPGRGAHARRRRARPAPASGPARMARSRGRTCASPGADARRDLLGYLCRVRRAGARARRAARRRGRGAPRVRPLGARRSRTRRDERSRHAPSLRGDGAGAPGRHSDARQAGECRRRVGLAGSLAGAAAFAALAAVGGRLPAWAAAVAAYPALLAAPIAWVVVRVARIA